MVRICHGGNMPLGHIFPPPQKKISQEPLHEPTCGVCWAHLTESGKGRWEWSVESSPSPTSDPRTLICGPHTDRPCAPRILLIMNLTHCVIKKINNKKWTISLPHAHLSSLRALLFRCCSSLPMIFRRCFQIPSLVGPHAWQHSRLKCLLSDPSPIIVHPCH